MSNNEGVKPTSRRQMLQGSLAVLAASAATVAGAKTAAAQEKLAQNIVQYQETPNDGHKCVDCVNYIDPGACKIVEGTINPNGWCVAFAPKGG